MRAALAACGAPVVASYVLAGGRAERQVRRRPCTRAERPGSLDQPMYAARGGRRPLVSASSPDRLDTTPATLAVAFALGNPAVATVLFGATSPAQVEQNVAALELDARLTTEDREELSAIGR